MPASFLEPCQLRQTTQKASTAWCWLELTSAQPNDQCLVGRKVSRLRVPLWLNPEIHPSQQCVQGQIQHHHAHAVCCKSGSRSDPGLNPNSLCCKSCRLASRLCCHVAPLLHPGGTFSAEGFEVQLYPCTLSAISSTQHQLHVL
jgi:hypothetical protein